MNERIGDVLSDFEDIISRAQVLTFLPRDSDLQENSVNELKDYIKRLNFAQELAVKNKDEDMANKILAVRCGCRAIRSELDMWLSLKSEEWIESWGSLVDAQDFLRSAQSAHKMMRKPNIQNMQDKYRWVEKFVFPPQTYLSPGFVVKKFVCSICGEDYEKCDHIEGLPYWGKFCNRIIADIEKVQEISVVEEPKDKGCRIIHFTTEEGLVRNKMTWKTYDPEEIQNFPEFETGEKIFTGIVMKPNGTYGRTQKMQEKRG
ncbi:hypothetical protein AMET1_0550 [Methanonatronarchaeum thermophilum]|uniref:Uncharacterized protein n=1 Tax=Methanonatronarchaeum thermophilum TaxID=1927129 RepID=A0A1Y3GBW0_9EURY|nr:hypothetical protein [Methanonatronarchaeum thermophilum]OUJ18899.1 hypothetical protein AMET1_0550 [Methanonatronarchaeum thermophilum]